MSGSRRGLGRPHRQSSKYGLACLGGLRGLGSPHRRSSNYGSACPGGLRVWGRRVRAGTDGRTKGWHGANGRQRQIAMMTVSATPATNSRHKSNLQWIKLQTVPRTRTPVNVDMQHPQRRPVPRAETTNTFKTMEVGLTTQPRLGAVLNTGPLQKTHKNLVGIFSKDRAFASGTLPFRNRFQH